MRLVLAIALLVTAPAAQARPAEHVRASLTIDVAGVQAIPGGVHFSPIRDPFEGAWRGSATWRVDCPNATWWGWKVFLVDISSGSFHAPADVERRMSGHARLFDNHYSPSKQGGSQVFTIPAGSYVYPYLEGTCDVDGHDVGHGAFTEGEPIFVAPYVWYPTFVGPGRSLQASGAVVLRRGKQVTARFRVVENATGKERVIVSFVGAGVRVRKQFAAGQLDLARSVTFRPSRAGVIRYSATMEGRSSLVYGIRVR